VDGLIGQAVVAGLFATAALDVWQRLLLAVLRLPPTNWALIGRWFAHMAHGRFKHESIAEAHPVGNELAIGWIAHYAVGVVYGVAYVGLIVIVLSGTPSALNGLTFGAASVVIPWFVMQPALGLGVMGAKAPNPAVPRYSAPAAHCIFGLALYAGAALYTSVAV
jgi:hypothetical protein